MVKLFIGARFLGACWRRLTPIGYDIDQLSLSCGFLGKLHMASHAQSKRSMQHVKENSAATPRHTKKHNPNTKSNHIQLASCGAAENATPTQREKNGLFLFIRG